MDDSSTALRENCIDNEKSLEGLIKMERDVHEMSSISYGSDSNVIDSKVAKDSAPVETLPLQRGQAVVHSQLGLNTSDNLISNTNRKTVISEVASSVPDAASSTAPQCGHESEEASTTLIKPKKQISVPLNINYMAGTGAEMPPWLVVVPRLDWRAKPAKSVTPQEHSCVVMFTYTTDTDPCFTLEKCKKIVRKIQKFHMEGGMSDIPYNFLVGGDGLVYEGRGWHVMPRTEPQYLKLKGHVLEIAFIGDYSEERPSEAMFDAALNLVDYGRTNLWIHEKFGLIENYEIVDLEHNPIM